MATESATRRAPADELVDSRWRRMAAREARSEVATTEDVFALCQPARLFSGDVWFRQRRPDGLCFALGDVAGKGIGAAVFMAMIAEELEHRFARPEAPALTGLVAGLNTTLRREMPSNRFASLIVGHLDPNGRLRLVNAGHCPALVRRRDGAVETVFPTGPVLGILAEPSFGEAVLRLDRGEAVVLFSDGLLEATSPDGRELGLEGIAGTLAGTSANAAAGIAAALLTGLDAHLGGEPPHDDLSLIVVKRPQDGESGRGLRPLSGHRGSR